MNFLSLQLVLGNTHTHLKMVAIKSSSSLEFAKLLNVGLNTKKANFVHLRKMVAYPMVETYAKTAWSKYGFVKSMMNSKGFFVFKFSSTRGMEDMLESGPQFICNIRIILRTLTPNSYVHKRELTRVWVWVKFHGIPISAFTADELSLIATKLGIPSMLNSYVSFMCMDSWVRSSYARVTIDLWADIELRECMIVVVLRLDGKGANLATIWVEYEWKSPICASCKIFGNCNEQCTKNIISDVLSSVKVLRQPIRDIHLPNSKPMVVYKL
ncbi:zf-CCHC domain-containing protein [Tanacetum coccineum]